MNGRTAGIVVVAALAVIGGAAGLALAGGSTAADLGENGTVESVADEGVDDGGSGETVTKSVRTESQPTLQQQQPPSGELTLIRGEPDLEVHARSRRSSRDRRTRFRCRSRTVAISGSDRRISANS